MRSYLGTNYFQHYSQEIFLVTIQLQVMKMDEFFEETTNQRIKSSNDLVKLNE